MLDMLTWTYWPDIGCIVTFKWMVSRSSSRLYLQDVSMFQRRGHNFCRPIFLKEQPKNWRTKWEEGWGGLFTISTFLAVAYWQNMFSVHALSILCACSEFTPSMLGVCSEHALSILLVCTEYALSIFWVCSDYALSMLLVCTEYALHEYGRLMRWVCL